MNGKAGVQMLHQAVAAQRRREVQAVTMLQERGPGLVEDMVPVVIQLADERGGFSRRIVALERELQVNEGYRAVEALVEEQLRVTASLAFHMGLYMGLTHGPEEEI